MRVLVACEFSGIVRDAFLALGHDAWSCDLLPSERGTPQVPGPHIRGDVLDKFGRGDVWDLMIAFPPCTHLAVSGAAWFKRKQKEQAEALEFVRALLDAPIPRIALENPVSVISTRIRKPDQIIQPFQFGHPERKTTCLWLKGLPKLVPTNVVEPDVARAADGTPRTAKRGKLAGKAYSPVHYEPPGPDRWKNRSRTYQGIADAMAEQWGGTA